MYESATIEDFADVISEPFEQAVAAAKKAAQAVEVQAAMRGAGGSRVVHAMVEAVEVEFDKGIAVAFRRYQREERRQLHEAEDMWRVLEERSAWFLSGIQAIAGHEYMKSKAYYDSMRPAIDEGLKRLAEKMTRRLRHLKVGSWAGEETEVNDLVILNGNYIKGNNNVVSGSGNVAQQGTVSSHQTVVTSDQLAKKVEELDKELATARLSNEQFASIRIDIDAIKGQLTKPSPDSKMVRAAVDSIRRVIEGTVAGALSSPLGLVVMDLVRMVGLS